MTAATDAAQQTERLNELSRRHGLGGDAAEKLQSLIGVLAHDPLAPTTVRDPGEVLDNHIADSLVALELEATRAASHLADLGSGAGLPGLPLAIARPSIRVALIESAARKCAFIARAIRECGIQNAEVVQARAESWPEGLERFDLVTARALAPLEVVVEYAAPLLTVGGTLVAWRGRRDRDAEVAAARAASELGMEPAEIRRVRPYEGAKHHHLHLMSKVRETPYAFPRRPGMATKRPLGR